MRCTVRLRKVYPLMTRHNLLTTFIFLQLYVPVAWSAERPLAEEALVFSADSNGVIAVEAEHYYRQTNSDVRAFYLTHSQQTPTIKPDGDPSHVAGASGGAYLEILPDTRRTHSDRLIRKENFSPEAGRMAVLSYKVRIKQPGRYYVWVRAHSTGSEDNGLHVGIDDTWPATGQRLQWCEGKQMWRWDSKQRTQEKHCGEPHRIYLDIEKQGEHVIQFSMREDGFEFDKWLLTTNREFKRPAGIGPPSVVASGTRPAAFPFVEPKPKLDQTDTKTSSPTTPVSSQPLQLPRQQDGNGAVRLSGELRQWHNITLDLNGPWVHEQDNQPNPFTDYRMNVTFRHSDGTEQTVPGYFAADGNAANTGAESGYIWRAHFAPDRQGTWSYRVSFVSGHHVALDADADAKPTTEFDGRSGSFEVQASNKTGRDLRAHGQLRYVGKRYLQFAGTGKYFLKAGADAPETLLAYRDFDNTHAGNPKKAPLKTWGAHIRDWQEGDPTWQDNKGKGLIGAVNYLSGKGCNAFSFLTYNAGGDGDNVWPFIHRNDKLHYDCSKLDQWGIVFQHGTQRGMYLHFKLQETENDDHRKGKGGGFVPESLDGGQLGPQRKLYCRELIARFGHNLALNWNLGEENTQSTRQQQDMINYISELDTYDHNIVIHTYPNEQDKVYRPLLGNQSRLTGVSLQNSSLDTTHAQTVKWVLASEASGRPWVVAFDESGSAAHAQCPDLGYNGFDGHDHDGKMVYTPHEVRKRTLWGHLMAGGGGNEYYFGYKFDQNDIVCEDWRSRDQSWDYCRIALQFFDSNRIPFWEMQNADHLAGNNAHDNSKYCFCKPGQIYLVYLPEGGTTRIDLTETTGEFRITWFNPREGGELREGSVTHLQGGTMSDLGTPPTDGSSDWLAVIRKVTE